MKKGERRKRSMPVKRRIDQVRRWKGERARLERVDGMFLCGGSSAVGDWRSGHGSKEL